MTDRAIIIKDGATVFHTTESAATVDANGKLNIPSGQTYDINGTPHSHTASNVYDSDVLFSDTVANNADSDQHGFLPKLSGDSDTWLDGLGAWTTPPGSGGGGTETMWIGAMWSGNYGDFAIRGLGSVNVDTYLSFCVPSYFSAMVECVLVIIPAATQAGATFDITTDYGAAGQAYNTHSEGVTPTGSIDLTQDIIYELDLTGALTALAAGDYVGVAVDRNTNPTCEILGIRFKFTTA